MGPGARSLGALGLAPAPIRPRFLPRVDRSFETAGVHLVRAGAAEDGFGRRAVGRFVINILDNSDADIEAALIHALGFVQRNFAVRIATPPVTDGLSAVDGLDPPSV